VSHLRVASKYPNLTRRHFERQGIQAEVVKLNGAMELAPGLGLASRIVDLVSTGRTLKDNGLVETSRILDISARLIVNRAALKTDERVGSAGRTVPCVGPSKGRLMLRLNSRDPGFRKGIRPAGRDRRESGEDVARDVR
jgi:ATP phosphoribosyltransferase